MKLHLKYLMICCLILISIYSYANVRDGLYVGGGVGSSTDELDLTVTRINSALSVHSDADNSNWLGNVFLGYGTTFYDAYFLAGELGANFPSHSVAIHARSDLTFLNLIPSNNLTIQDYLTFDVLPGYALTENILFYGRLGLSYSSLTLKQPTIGPLGSLNTSENKFGGRFGVGANLSVSNSIALGLDYFYSAYQDMSIYSFPTYAHFATNVNSNYLGLSLLYQIW